MCLSAQLEQYKVDCVSPCTVQCTVYPWTVKCTVSPCTVQCTFFPCTVQCTVSPCTVQFSWCTVSMWLTLLQGQSCQTLLFFGNGNRFKGFTTSWIKIYNNVDQTNPCILIMKFYFCNIWLRGREAQKLHDGFRNL